MTTRITNITSKQVAVGGYLIQPGHYHDFSDVDAQTYAADFVHLFAAKQITVTPTKYRRQEYLGAIPASANLHSAFAAGAPISSAISWTAAIPPRNMQLSTGNTVAGVVAFIATITGTDPFGNPQVEVINVPASPSATSVVAGHRAWGSVTHFATNIDPTDTVTLQTGNGFAVGAPFTDIDFVGVDFASASYTILDASTGCIITTTGPNGTHTYIVRYRTLTLNTNPAA